MSETEKGKKIQNPITKIG